LVADAAAGGPLINPFLGNIITGGLNQCDAYQGAFTGPSSFGRGPQTFANNGTGDTVGMLFNGGNNPFVALLVPQDYVSGTALSDSATYNNTTLVTLFVTPGTYVWTWGMERTRGSRSRSGRWASHVSLMAARPFLCSVSVCSAWLRCGANCVVKSGFVRR
jgi:hypothetical protein